MPYLQRQNPNKGICKNGAIIFPSLLPQVQKGNNDKRQTTKYNRYQWVPERNRAAEGGFRKAKLLRASRLDAEPITCEKS